MDTYSSKPGGLILLKQDSFGAIRADAAAALLVRDTDAACWWARPLARQLAKREATALDKLTPVEGVPRLRSWNGRRLTRELLPGQVLFEAENLSYAWFRDAARLLRRMHRLGITHNDLAKEANCLVLTSGAAGLVDFQLAVHAPRRGRLFRMLAREDLRHLLKHKRCYFPDKLTAREMTILATPSLPAKLWMNIYKPLYLLVTRGILRWPERSGPEERVQGTGKYNR